VSNRTLAWVAAISVTAASAVTVPARPAEACTTAEPPVFTIDQSLRASDRTPPEPFTGVGAIVQRRASTQCNDDECTTNSCGDSAWAELTFDPPSDAELGYRVVLLRGQLPGFSFRVEPVGPSIVLDLDFRATPGLDADIALVAIDRAGNESVPSEPIHLEFSGCTLPPIGETCNGDTPMFCSVGHVSGGSRRSAGGAALIAGWIGFATIVRLRRRVPRRKPLG
jgi:hypothetical protein